MMKRFLRPRLWTLNGLSLAVSQCDVRSIHFSVEENIGLSKAGMGLMVDIHNRSFGSVNVSHPRTEISITDCYLDTKGTSWTDIGICVLWENKHK